MKCRHHRGRGIHAVHRESILDESLRDRDPVATAKIQNSAPWRKRPSPPPDGRDTDRGVPPQHELASKGVVATRGIVRLLFHGCSILKYHNSMNRTRFVLLLLLTSAGLGTA